MKNIILTTFIIGKNNINLGNIPNSVEILPYTNDNDLDKAKGKYISFIDSEDSISDNYFDRILKEIKRLPFDICYINYEIKYNYKRKQKIRIPNEGIHNILPIYNPYIWNYVFKKESIPKFKDFSIQEEDLTEKRYISDIIYFHNPNKTSNIVLNMPTKRPSVYYKNIVYMDYYCGFLFNGYITWLLEIGKAFPDLDITILYTSKHEITHKNLSKYFQCIEYNPNVNYVCDKLITTYATYFYPTNIYSLEENSIFIHGNMADYENSRKFTDDIYDRYIAVSKTSRDKAKGYFPKEVEFIYNPYTHDEKSIKPHLRLISALRNAPEKGMDRIKILAKILDEENIPYTWQIFTNVLEPNQGGLIFREGVANVIDFINDSDYLVQLSSTEALSYSLTEALCCKTKLITTDLPAVQELNITEGKNIFIIPFDYFEEKNKEKLRKIVLEAYNKKDVEFDYHYDKSRFQDYYNVFNK